jgi:hypothetical protein
MACRLVSVALLDCMLVLATQDNMVLDEDKVAKVS